MTTVGHHVVIVKRIKLWFKGSLKNKPFLLLGSCDKCHAKRKLQNKKYFDLSQLELFQLDMTCPNLNGS